MMPSLPNLFRRTRGLSAFAAVALGFMVLVILWGAVVRATGSGAGCGNHWPLCNGDFVPRHPRLATIIEFTHRSMSGVCTALVAALLTWTFSAMPKGHRARKAATASAVLLFTEALLGAVLVKGGYVEGNTSSARVLMQCVHFTNTMLLLGALSLTWAWLHHVRSSPSLSPRPATNYAWFALISSLAAGATGSVAALADTLFPSPTLSAALAQDLSATAPLLVRMRVVHPLAVVFVAVSVVLLFRARPTPAAGVALWAMLLQLLLGPLDVLLLAPVWLQILHLLGADIFWIALVVACAQELDPTSLVANRTARLMEHQSATV